MRIFVLSFAAGLMLLFLAPAPSLALEPFVDPVLGIRFIPTPGGCFELGDTFGHGQADERPTRDVCLSDFFIADREVSVGMFQQFMADMGYRTGPEKKGYCYTRAGEGRMAQALEHSWSRPGFLQDLEHPVVCVTPADAEAFADWLSEKAAGKFRLPTEAEWEFACRAGGRQMEYGTYTGEIDPNLAHYLDPGAGIPRPRTAQGGSLPPNPAGLYDMSGNVYEWVQDAYDGHAYSNLPGRDPVRTPEKGGDRVKRGGGFALGASQQRCANRGSNPFAANDIGFRLVLEP